MTAERAALGAPAPSGDRRFVPMLSWLPGYRRSGKFTRDLIAGFCHRDHEALHEGGYRLNRTGSHHWRIHRPDGTPLRPEPIPIDPGGTALSGALAGDGIDITETTTSNDSDGQPLTRDAIDTLDPRFLTKTGGHTRGRNR